MILMMLMLGCAKPPIPTVSVDIVRPQPWAWHGPIPCPYEVVAFAEGSAWTPERAIELMEMLLAEGADHILNPKMETETLWFDQSCEEVDIPTCEEGSGTDEYGETYTYGAHATRVRFEGTAVRWIRELCGGWPDDPSAQMPPSPEPVR